MDKIEEILTRGVANVIPNKKGLEKLLRSGKKLNVYLGIDPTAPQIHLGHAVPLRKLQAFVELGHNVTFLIGDFTALIGDMSDKDSERPVLTTDEIKKNFKTYREQAQKILDFSKVKIKYNSEWLKKLSFEEIMRLTQHFSAGDFVGRELIKKRLNEGKRVGLHELLYPVMQGYDSYFMDTDIQIGGTDQTFNMQAGRILQKDLRNRESFIIAMEFLMGTDSRKMSKTWGNAIWFDDEPNEIYRKVMAINDDLIIQYFTLATNTPLSEIEKIKERLQKGENPMALKKELASIVTRELQNKKAADKSALNFQKTVQEREIPEKIPIFESPALLGPTPLASDLLTTSELASSISEAKRLIKQGGVSINNEVLKKDMLVDLKNGDLIRVGKRRIKRIKLNK